MKSGLETSPNFWVRLRFNSFGRESFRLSARALRTDRIVFRSRRKYVFTVATVIVADLDTGGVSWISIRIFVLFGTVKIV